MQSPAACDSWAKTSSVGVRPDASSIFLLGARWPAIKVSWIKKIGSDLLWPGCSLRVTSRGSGDSGPCALYASRDR